jgi:hypothetical protein
MHLLLISIIIILAMRGLYSALDGIMARLSKNALRNYYLDRIVADYLSRNQ